jgi:predicted amidophosphoribosyltransferase
VLWRPLLDLIFPPQCASCSALGAGLCNACARGETIAVRFPALRVTAFGAYEGSLRAAVLALKDGRRDVAESLGQLVASLFQPNSLVVPVPTTARRRRIRGIDGVALVAHCAAAIAGARVIEALRRQPGEAQHGRSRAQRLEAWGRFACDPAKVAGRRVTLFDDVCTTGTTLRDCAAALRETGASIEDAVVVAATKSAQSWEVPTVS